MSKKIVPTSLRLGVNKDWRSIWYADKKSFAKSLMQDIIVKREVKKAFSPAGLDSIIVSRYQDRLEVTIYVARPGVAIGRGGSALDEMKKKLKQICKTNIELNVKEVKKPDISARIIARAIADGIERRQPSKLLIASAKEKAMLGGAKGIKIMVSGRINNNSQARVQKDSAGPVPTQTLKANIDYAEETAQTADAGLFGVKVWVYKPNEVLDEVSK